jgi:cysteine desulfurase
VALRGVLHLRGGGHIVTTAMEHRSVAGVVESLCRDGARRTVVPPDATGCVSPAALRDAILPDTVLVSVIAADGEVGAVQPVATVAAVCRERGIPLHTDATQAVGRLPVTVETLGCDLLSLSAHKFGGPKGAGALYVRRGLDLPPLLEGGGQERGLRSGTLNVPGIVGLGAAARILLAERDVESRRLSALTDRLWNGIRAIAPDAVRNGPVERLPGNLNVVIPRVSSEALMLALPGFAFSAGSACQSGHQGISPILAAMGMDSFLPAGAVRFGLGRINTEEHVDRLLADLARALRRLRPVLDGASDVNRPAPARYN